MAFGFSDDVSGGTVFLIVVMAALFMASIYFFVRAKSPATGQSVTTPPKTAVELQEEKDAAGRYNTALALILGVITVVALMALKVNPFAIFLIMS